jgi:hypothetical protein
MDRRGSYYRGGMISISTPYWLVPMGYFLVLLGYLIKGPQ